MLGAPSRTVDKIAIERVESRDTRPFPIVQNPRSVYENMAVILDYLAGLQNTDFDSPNSFCLLPCCLADVVLQPDVLVELILPCDSLEILQNFIPWRIAKLINNVTWRTASWCGLLMSPLGVRLPGELIVVRWNVTSASRVSMPISIINNSSPGCDQILACFRTMSLLRQSSSRTQ